MSVILIEQQIVHYEVLGHGRPLIFLHGWVGSWRYWIPVMQAASVSFRAYAVDLWGFGDTAKHTARYGLSGQVNLLDSFLNTLGIGRVAVVGHGLGAVVAGLFALRNPAVVDRIMAVSCPLNDSYVNPRLRSTAFDELVEWLLGKSPLTEPVRLEVPKADPRAIDRSLEEMRSLEDNWIANRQGAVCLMVNGQNDPLITAPDLDEMVSLPERIHALVFEQSGHFPMLDEGSKFNRLLVDFLNLPSGESPRQLQMKEEWKRRVR